MAKVIITLTVEVECSKDEIEAVKYQAVDHLYDALDTDTLNLEIRVED